ncbi:protein Hook homolog 2-like isoform X2 [Scleropages formosus]|uniref:protein Hook homolog 2-like isoform X2 n=1 Tax=Scleropages formosus TaxID=113540 RepID=UPI000878AB60|nr:protein Hook homolog 2 isoform X2 [Scleropages formosus]
MSLEKAELCDSLLRWLQTFQVPSCGNKRDLTSGVAIAHVLHRIDSSWFNETWLGRIKEESASNWRLKVSNLKKILHSMLEYYHDVLAHPVSDEHLPDVTLIGEMEDLTELVKLVQLVLGCAVSCERKHEHIEQIMTLEESVQHVVMTSIQELLAKETVEPGTPETYGDFDYQSRKYYFLSEEMEEKEDLTKRCRDLENQLSVVMEEKTALLTETRSLKERLSVCEPPDVTSAITSKKLLLLQSQMEQLQEENFRLENIRDDLRVHVEQLERQVSELQHRNEDLTSLAEEAQALKDEMDILRHSSERVGGLEALVETYKRKLEDLGDLRRQVRLLEERNNVYMQRTCELEEELRRANAVRTQLDTYKRQVHDLSTKHSSEAVKAEKWQFEYRNLLDKYEALQKEKERLISERDTLRETNEELRCAQVQQRFLSQAGSAAIGNLASEIMPTEFKETVVRLQNENRMLCAQEESYVQQLAKVQSQLEQSQRSQNALETQNRLDQQQILELRCQVEELQKALQEQGSKTEDSSLLKRKLEEHLEKLHEAHSDLQKKKEVINDLEPGMDSNMAKKISELQEILRKKDEDMKQMEERYQQYVEKARMVIKTMEPRKTPSISPDVMTLRNQLTEKERRIQYLEQDFEKSKSRHEQEEKLILSAWYNMVGLALNQKMASDRSGPPGQAQSFLAQQRLATNARRGTSHRLQLR